MLSPLPEGRRYAVAGVTLFGICAAIVGVTVWLLPLATADRVAGTVGSAVTAALLASSLLLPWRRLPRMALRIYPALNLVNLFWLGKHAHGLGTTYTACILFAFVFAGFTGSSAGVLVLVVPSVATWLVLNDAFGSGDPAILGVRLGIAVSLWITVGLALAHRTRNDERRRSDLLAQARLDPLTGLDNRRSLDDALKALRPRDAVVVIDIDEFRDINTDRGHSGGDTVLAEFGRTVRVGLRSHDHAIRQGGDEFLLLLVDVNDAQVLTVLTRLRERWRGACGSVTFSAGATHRRDGEDVADTVRRADAHCYRAKAGGRDQWVLDDPEGTQAPEFPAPGVTAPCVTAPELRAPAPHRDAVRR